MKKLLIILLSIALLFGGGSAFADDDKDVPELIAPVGVKLDTAVVTRQDIYNLNYYDAAVVPHVDKITFTVDGQIDTFSALIGDKVKKGDVLATLNQDEQEEQAQTLKDKIEYLQSEMSFTQRADKLDLASAQLELERVTAKVKTGEATDNDVKLKQEDIEILKTQQKQAHDISALEMASLKRQLSDIESTLGSNVITAPYDGRIVYMKDVQRGTSVKAYDPIYFIADDTRMSIDSAYISSSTVAAADDMFVRIGSDDYKVTPKEFDWREYVAIALAGGELRTGFDFQDPSSIPDSVQCGQYAAVFVKTGLVENALAIPANALYTDANGRYVYKIDGETRARVYIGIGRVTSTLVQITDGLKEGDTVYVKE